MSQGDGAAAEPVWVQHGLVRLALHPLRASDRSHALLLLHGLGESSAVHSIDVVAQWPGPVWGLDFTGHGRSSVPAGGGYTAEVLMGDADLALSQLGPSTVLGRGLGAYIALLIAGARPRLVRGAILADGPGMAGGGVGPTSSTVLTIEDSDGPGEDHRDTGGGHRGPPDPWALLELSRDVRPADYAASFARQATQLSDLASPLAVCARWRPPWLEAVASEPGTSDVTLPEALALYA